MSDFAPAIPMPSCHDQQSREIYPVEAPCPLCGKMQEYFNDELRTKELLRCFSCKKIFEADLFREAAQKQATKNAATKIIES